LGIRPTERLTTDKPTTPVAPVTVTVPATPVTQVTPAPVVAQSATSDEKKPELTDAERARLFQSNFSKEQERAKQLEQQNATLQQQIAFMNQFVANMQGALPAQKAVVEDEPVKLKEPDIAEFVKDYDPDEGVSVNDSGYRKFLKAQREYDKEMIKRDVAAEITHKIKTESRLEVLKSNAAVLCEKYPEFKTPTGEPNWLKIKNDLGAFVEGGDLINAKEFVDFKSGKVPVQATQATPTLIQQIETIANEPSQRIPSVANANQVSGVSQEISQEAQQLKRMFGKV
jgi:hypothetical protein